MNLTLDVELLGMQRGIALDQHVLADEFLELCEPTPVVGLEDFDGFRVDAEENVGALEVLPHLAQLGVDLVADCCRALDHAGGLAGGARYREGPLQRLLDTLAGDGDEAEVVELEDLGGGAIGFEGFFEGGHDLEAVLAVVHVNEVNDDDAAEVAEANLADDLGDGVEVGLDDGVLKAGRLANVLAGVDVDGDERFGLVDDDGSAALEPDLGAESLGDFILNTEVLEERSLLGVELDATHQRGRIEVEELDDALVVGFRINPDGREVAVDLVAQDALDQPGVVKDQGGGLQGVGALLDIGPQIQQHAEIGAEFFFRRALGGGADDKPARGFAALVNQNPLEALALFVGGDLAADADMRDGGHEDQEAAGEGYVRGDARALLGNGLLGDLDQNLLVGLEQVADDGEIGHLHGAARRAAASVGLSPRRCRSAAPAASARESIAALLS